MPKIWFPTSYHAETIRGEFSASKMGIFLTLCSFQTGCILNVLMLRERALELRLFIMLRPAKGKTASFMKQPNGLLGLFFSGQLSGTHENAETTSFLQMCKKKISISQRAVDAKAHGSIRRIPRIAIHFCPKMVTFESGPKVVAIDEIW